MTLEETRTALQLAVLARITPPLMGILAWDPRGGLAIFHGPRKNAPADKYPCLTYRTELTPNPQIRKGPEALGQGGRVAKVTFRFELWDNSTDSTRLSAAKAALETQLDNVCFDLAPGAGRCFFTRCTVSGEPTFDDKRNETFCLLSYELHVQAT